MNIIHGNAFLQFGEDTLIKASWSGHYLAKNNGYKMRLSGDNIEKDFYLYCDGNETIKFLIKKTASELGRGTRQSGLDYFGPGSGSGSGIMKQLECKINCQVVCGLNTTYDLIQKQNCAANCRAECARNPNFNPNFNFNSPNFPNFNPNFNFN